MKRLARYRLHIAVVIVSASVVFAVSRSLRPYVESPTVNLAGDVDWGYLNRGLDRIHGLEDTGRWWTGPWCGEVPFWRPLTSYVFWAMRLLWPKELMLPREIVLILLHLGFVLLAGLLLCRLTGRPWLVLLTVWLFAGARPFPVNAFFPPPSAVRAMLADPKNIPEPLVGISVLGSLLLLSRGRWLASLLVAAVGVGFKETGFVAWPLAVIVLAWINRTRIWSPGGCKYVLGAVLRNRLSTATWLGVLVCLSVIHMLAVGWGYTFGANRFWWLRAAIYTGGPVVRRLLGEDPAVPLTAVLVVVSLIGLRGRCAPFRLGGVLISVAVGVLVSARLLDVSWDVSLARMLDPRCMLVPLILSVFWIWAAWEARRDWQTAVLGISMGVIASLPTWLGAQTQVHTRYLSALFLELTAAAALYQLGLATIFGRRKTPVVPQT